MEFKFSDEHNALRAEVKAFLKETVPSGPGPARPTSQENWPEQIDFLQKLAAKNWVAPAWPVQYGGLGWAHIKQMIFSEELSYAGSPDAGRVFNVGMIGPTLIVHGTEDEIVPADQATKAQSINPDHSQLVMISGADHFFSQQEHRDFAVRKIAAWFARISEKTQ